MSVLLLTQSYQCQREDPGLRDTLGAAAGPAHYMGFVEGRRTVYIGDCADLVRAEVLVGSLADHWRLDLVILIGWGTLEGPVRLLT